MEVADDVGWGCFNCGWGFCWGFGLLYNCEVFLEIEREGVEFECTLWEGVGWVG